MEDISTYIAVTIKKNSDGTFELLILYMVEKIINHVVLTVSTSLNERETLAGKILLHKDESSLERNRVCNYKAAFGMLSYIQGSILP